MTDQEKNSQAVARRIFDQFKADVRERLLASADDLAATVPDELQNSVKTEWRRLVLAAFEKTETEV